MPTIGELHDHEDRLRMSMVASTGGGLSLYWRRAVPTATHSIVWAEAITRPAAGREELENAALL